MPFNPHAFISYAHIDNEPARPGKPRWVTEFHGALEVKLRQWLGGEVKVWLDHTLQADTNFSQEIIDRLRATGLLVSVVSPRYLLSAWCQREVATFEAAAAAHGGIDVGNRSRVLKVLKMPLPPGARLPPVLDRTLGVPFYVRDGQVDSEIDPTLGADAETEFLRRVYQLAALMADRLRALGVQPAADAALPPPSGQVVYVAECGRDLQAIRDALVTELRLHGHAVLPDAPLPQVEDALRAEVQADLAQATLAVHLVGNSAGAVPDGPAGQSVVQVQAALGAERSAAAGLPRIVWLPTDARAERPEHQAFIDRLQADAALQQGADLLRGDAETLKAAVHQTLARLRQPAPGTAPAAGQRPRVHLVLTPQDRALARDLIGALEGHGLEVSVPGFSGDAAELRRTHAERVAAASAVLLVHGAGDDAWADAQASDLRKQAALAERPPRLWRLVAAPRTAAKDRTLLVEDPDTLLDMLGSTAATVAATVAAALGVAPPADARPPAEAPVPADTTGPAAGGAAP